VMRRISARRRVRRLPVRCRGVVCATSFVCATGWGRRGGVLLRHLIAALAALCLADSAGAAEPPRPNFLVILADDLGIGDVSAYRQADVRTAAIDRLAAEGMRFTSMRANCTVCSPSRAALLTGRHADRVGVPGVIRTHADNSWGYLDPAVPTLADELRAAGYHTAIVGKWHLGLTSPNTPTERGFDHFHGFLGDMMDSYTTHRRHGENYMRLNGEEIDPPGHATELFTDWAIAWLRERAALPGRPFFLYLAYNAPHFPIEPPADWLARVEARVPGLDAKRAANVAFVEHLDHGVGRVLDALRDTGLDRDTLVVFTSDNGGSLPHAQNNDPWRGGKQDHYDGGLRVPFIVRYPGLVTAGTVSDHVGLSFDIVPTFLELAGRPLPADLDAVSLLPALRGEAADHERRELYFTRREGGPAYGGKSYEALIRGRWKLMQNAPFSPLELYDLGADPQEQNDLAAERKDVLRELSTALRRHIQRGGRTPWQPR
jgi:arylsulfatase A-like enzyme